MSQDVTSHAFRGKNSGDEVYKVRVDYSQGLKQMIEAGQYDKVDLDITPLCLPGRGEGAVETELVLVDLDRWAVADEVLTELETNDLRPADMAELLALGVQYPELQLQYPIAAFGSVWTGSNGDRSVGCLGKSLDKRYLYCLWLGYGWYEPWRFAAVRK